MKKKDVMEILVIVICIKVATFLLSYISFEIFLNTSPTIIDLWKRWDTSAYMNIAENGYTNIGQSRLLIVFFPLYPLLIRLFTFLVKDSLLSSLMISNLASVLTVFFFYELVSIDYMNDIGIRTIFYFSIFPTAYFLTAAYTESLFLFLTIASFYYARKDRWFLAGILGGLSSATRITGIVLFPALIAEYFFQKRKQKQMKIKEIILLLLVPLGFIIYLIINYMTFGDLFAFIAIQKQHWFKEFSFPWVGFMNTLGSISWKDPVGRIMTSYAEILFAIIGLLTVIAGFIYLRISYNVYSLLTWLLITSTGYWLSIPRYTITIFPLFILLSLAGQHKKIDYLITTMSITFFSLFLILFTQGRWAF